MNAQKKQGAKEPNRDEVLSPLYVDMDRDVSTAPWRWGSLNF